MTIRVDALIEFLRSLPPDSSLTVAEGGEWYDVESPAWDDADAACLTVAEKGGEQ